MWRDVKQVGTVGKVRGGSRQIEVDSSEGVTSKFDVHWCASRIGGRMRAGDTSLAVSKDEDEDGADSQRCG